MLFFCCSPLVILVPNYLALRGIKSCRMPGTNHQGFWPGRSRSAVSRMAGPANGRMPSALWICSGAIRGGLSKPDLHWCGQVDVPGLVQVIPCPTDL